MNTRNLTKVMLYILGFLIILIFLSALKNNQSEKEIDEEIHHGNANLPLINSDIELLNFFEVYDYFETDIEGEKMESYLTVSLEEYKTEKKTFNTTNINFKDNTLTFSLVSSDDEEEYKVTINKDETLLERIR